MSVQTFIFNYPYCERTVYLSKLRNQATNLGLAQTFIDLIDNLIFEMLPYIKIQDTENVTILYDTNIDALLALRDSAFTEWANDVKNMLVPVDKTPVPMQEP